MAFILLLGSATITPAQEAQNWSDIPTFKRESTDPTLPGSWYILDRSKPIPKLVDRESLVPTGPKRLVMFGKSKTMAYPGPMQKCGLLFTLPADVGQEQLLLGCLASVRSKEGKDFPCTIQIVHLKSRSNRYAEVVVEPCPAEFTVSIQLIMLLPPSLTVAERQTLTKTLVSKASGVKKDWKETPGFPAPEFTDGGPVFINAQSGRTPFLTIANVLTKTSSIVKPNFDQKYISDDNQFMDPAVIKTVKEGACGQVTRLAEKSLAGVARASYVHSLADERIANEGGRAENDYPGASHALLLIEDPETGKYFLGDFRFSPPYMGPHTGNTVLHCVILREDESLNLPSKLPWKLLKTQTIADMIAAPLSPKSSAVMLYTASTCCGKDRAQYEAWLKSAPPDFKELADKLNRSTK